MATVESIKTDAKTLSDSDRLILAKELYTDFKDEIGRGFDEASDYFTKTLEGLIAGTNDFVGDKKLIFGGIMLEAIDAVTENTTDAMEYVEAVVSKAGKALVMKMIKEVYDAYEAGTYTVDQAFEKFSFYITQGVSWVKQLASNIISRFGG